MSRALVVALALAGCRGDPGKQPDVVPPDSPPDRAAFGDAIEGVPIIRVGQGHVTAVLDDDAVVLRAIVNGRITDLVRFVPHEDDCPVIDIGDAYFVHGHTCGDWALMALPLPNKRLECDELAWTGTEIVVAHRSRVDTTIELPPACR